MNTEMAVVMLDQLETHDPEAAHTKADDILLCWARENGGAEVAQAYRRAVERAPYWGHA